MKDPAEPTLIIVGRRGRRRRSDGPSTERLEIRMTAAERRELDHVAATTRKSIATIAREAINEFVGDFSEQKPFRTAKIQD